MEQKELEAYKALNSKFIKECLRVCNILCGITRYMLTDNRDISYAETFEINGDDIEWSGYEYFRGENYYHYGSFPAYYLTMSDDELKKIVEADNMKYNKEKEEEQKKKEAKEKECRRKQYEELKEEFEKNGK